jgi:methionyl-tRNA formyltransferase
MNNKKSVFIGGKQIGANCLKVLIKKNLAPSFIIANISDKGIDTWHESLIKIAKKEKIKVIKNSSLRDEKLINKIRLTNPEIIFCIGSTQIVPDSVLKIPKLGTINIHPALLPQFRGRYSTVHAIFEGKKKTGVTLHWMTSELDGGPIISQKEIEIQNSDTAKTLYDKFTKEGTALFVGFLKKWSKGQKIVSKKQNKKNATYYSKALPNNGEINWDWDGQKIYNFIRSLTFEPFSPAKFSIGNKKMVIIDEKYFKGFE